MESFVEEGFDVDDFPKGYSYKVVEDSDSRMVIRIKEVKKEDEALEWLRKLNDVGLAIWRVQRTFPRAGKTPISNIFKQDMRCQHNSHKAYIGNKKRSKNTDCPAIMTILVKRTDIKYSRAAVKDNLLKDWPCIVKFAGQHNHDLFTACHPEISEDIKQQLILYFLKGHSSTSALHTLTTHLSLQHLPSVHFTDYLVPDRAACAYLYHVEFKPQLNEDQMTRLETLVLNYNESGGRAVLKTNAEGQRFIALCSSIMSRVHQLVLQSSEVLFVDSLSSTLHKQIHLYILFTVTPIGGLPLGVIITDTDDLAEQALSTLVNECFPKEQFYHKGQPQVIMSCGRTNEIRSVFVKSYPKSTWLQCQLSVLRRTWRWIVDPGNDVDRHDRLNVLQHVRELMYSCDESNFDQTLKRISSHHVMNNYPKFRAYLDELCGCRREWASCYRSGLPLRRHHTVGYAEPNLSMLKEVLKRGKRCFNMTQLFDFVSSVYETFLSKVLLAYSSGGRLPAELIHRTQPAPVDICEEDIVKHPSDDDLFLVKSLDKPDRNYSVNVSRFTCNCSEGLTTKMCKHLSAILQHKMLGNIQVETYNAAQARTVASQVATGQVFEVIQPVESVSSAQVQPMETNGLPPEMAFDHEELIQSEDSSIADLRSFTERIAQVSKENPDLFMPALKAMMINVQQYASNEPGLAMAMHSFGKYSGYETIGYILENVDGL